MTEKIVNTLTYRKQLKTSYTFQYEFLSYSLLHLIILVVRFNQMYSIYGN